MTPVVPLFDRIVMVDWSARAVPARGRDSLWIASLDRSAASRRPLVVNPATRRAAIEHIIELADSCRGRVLVGFDFSFGFPCGFAAALGLGGVPWRATSDLVAALLVDGPDNANNRFDVAAELNCRLAWPGGGPFWGCPTGHGDAHLEPRKPPPGPLPELRLVEQRLRRAGMRPFSNWQLAYAGSVGSQVLTGLGALDLIEQHPALSPRWVRWPFDTGFTTASIEVRPDAVVAAEVWPATFDVVVGVGEVRDEAQVRTVCVELDAADVDGRLAGWLAPELDAPTAAVALAEEGWTLGVS